MREIYSPDLPKNKTCLQNLLKYSMAQCYKFVYQIFTETRTLGTSGPLVLAPAEGLGALLAPCQVWGIYLNNFITTTNHYHKPLPQTTTTNHYHKPLPQTTTTNHYHKPLPQTTTTNHYHKPLPQTTTTNHYHKPLPQTTTSNHYQKPLPKTTTTNHYHKPLPQTTTTNHY